MIINETPAGVIRELRESVRRRRGKSESQGLYCYGFLKEDGQFSFAEFSRGDYYYMPSRSTKGRYVNASQESDWLSVSTFLPSNRGRIEENISHILCCFLDLDGDKLEIPLTDDIIRQRCKLLGLPMPLIIETSLSRSRKWSVLTFNS